MATITATSMGGSGSRAVTVTTCGASDTFTYTNNAFLVINNVSGVAITPNIDGDGGTSVPLSGVGLVDVSGGYDVASIADGAVAAIPLRSIRAYLTGTIAMTGADGAEAYILEY